MGCTLDSNPSQHEAVQRPPALASASLFLIAAEKHTRHIDAIFPDTGRIFPCYAQPFSLLLR